MSTLIVAALLWIALHLGIGGVAVRTWVAARLGERGFRFAFSLASVLSLLYLVHAKVETEGEYLWTAPPILRLALEIAMLPAIWLFLASVARPNPTLFGSSKPAPKSIRGVQRITRHPMLWAFAIWALVHIVVKGDSASLVFFGAFAVTAGLGMPSVDAKLAERNPSSWATLRDSTSVLPFAAIVSGRNRFVFSEVSWLGLCVAAAIWIALIFGHQKVLGYSILPTF